MYNLHGFINPLTYGIDLLIPPSRIDSLLHHTPRYKLSLYFPIEQCYGAELLF